MNRQRRRTFLTAPIYATLLGGMLGLTGLFGSPSPVAADALVAESSAEPSVEDFEFASWSTEWHVGIETTPGGKDRAYAEVTETIVPVFPEIDQNRGIVRSVPLAIGDERMDVSGVDVRDANGESVEFESEVSGGELVVAIGDDDFVHGQQAYVLTYTLRDVIADLGNPEVQELYANLLPTSRAQPIGTFSAQVTLQPELAEAVVGDASCYQGAVGATKSCEIIGDGQSYFVTPRAMPPGETLTIDIGFAPGTVPTLSLLDRVGWFPFAAAALPPIGLLTTLALFLVQWRRSRHASGGVVVAQYEPRADLPPQLAGQIVPSMALQAFPASVLDAAVHGAIRIEESGDAPVLRKLADATRLHPVERRFVDEVLFAELDAGAGSSGAATVSLSGNEAIAKAYPAFSQDPQNSAKTAGFFEKSAAAARAKSRTLWIAIISLVVTFVVFVYTVIAGAGVLIGITAAVLGALVVFVFASAVRPTHLRTEAGAEAKDHLMGLREYIKLSEADRIQSLQSAETADRVDEADGARVIQVYERLLPYAVMFRLDKSWAKELQARYESSGTSPYWLAGYQPAMFAATMSNVKQTAHTSMPAAQGGGASSSGFAGGGFAGGGVGGGSVGGR